MLNQQNVQSYRKETIRIRIRDMQNNPIANAKVTLLAMGQREGQKIALPDKTNFQGEIIFNLQEHIKNINRFEITINHPDYYPYPINRNRKICRSYEHGHLCEESFDKMPTFYFNGKMLNISHYPNPIKTYALKTPLNQNYNIQTQKEYYIQLQESSTSLKIYTDKNLTQESIYTLSLGTQNTKIESTLSQSQPNNTILSFESKESLKQFTSDIQKIIIKDKKKGNTNLVHRFVVTNHIQIIFKYSNFTNKSKQTNSQTLTYFQIHSSYKIKKLVYNRDTIQSIIKTKDIKSVKNSLQDYPAQSHTFDYFVNGEEKIKRYYSLPAMRMEK